MERRSGPSTQYRADSGRGEALTLGDAQPALLLLEAAEGSFQGLTHHGLAAGG